MSSREERKVVTVLFADLVGFTSRAEALDPEDVRALLSPYYVRLRSELERFGGTVEKFIGDAVMALFGAPLAHEDDPERAVRAALAIRDWVAEEGDLHVRIAVNTGDALISLGARLSEGEGMASGDVVNTTARLQSAAPVDGILVGEQTFRATERAVEYRPAEPVQAKGKVAPIPVWEAVQARARFGVDLAGAGRAKLVGRGRELDLLADALTRARAERSPQLVTLVGVPGIGKSRLVYELFQVVERDPELIRWRQGRSLSYGESVTYWALGEMAKAEAGVLESDGADEAAEKLMQSVREMVGEDEAEWVEGHLRPLVGLSGSAQLGQDRRGEAFAAWRRYIEGLAEQSPLVLVFEDLHWADDGLLDFVDHLAERASSVPMLLLCTARPELLERRPGWGGGKRNALTISLSPLADEDTARLIGALLDRPVLPASMQAGLLARAGGNPLYAEEFVRMLEGSGGGDGSELPETVQGIVAARLDLLPPDEKGLLQDAAVLGKLFWTDAAAVLGGRERWQVDELLHALERKEFIRRERRSAVAGESQYAFLHVLVRDIAYGQMPRAIRAEKHRRAAEWIDSLPGDRAEDRAEMLAHHYSSALEYARSAGQDTSALTGRAAAALRDAGDRAATLNAYVAAVRFYAAAVELAEAPDPYLLFAYGSALFVAEHRGAEELAAALPGLLERDDRETAATAEVSLGRLRWERGEQGVFEHLERAEGHLRDRPPSRAKAFVLCTLCQQYMLAGRSDRAIPFGDEALRMASVVGDEELRGHALNSRGVARINDGDLAGLAELEESLAIQTRINSLEAVRSYINLASVFVDLGEIRRAAELHAAGLELARTFGLAAGVQMLTSERVGDDYFLGRWDEALANADQFIAECEHAPHFMETVSRFSRAHIRLGRGEFDGAIADAEAGLALARRVGDPQTMYPSLVATAAVRVGVGDAVGAGTIVDELLAMWAADTRAFTRGPWLCELALTLVELGRPGDFRTETGARATTPWFDAAVACVQGEPERAASILESIGARSYEARLRLLAAEALVAAGRRAEADAQLGRALAFYREVGATRYVREGEALLAATA